MDWWHLSTPPEHSKGLIHPLILPNIHTPVNSSGATWGCLAQRFNQQPSNHSHPKQLNTKQLCSHLPKIQCMYLLLGPFVAAHPLLFLSVLQHLLKGHQVVFQEFQPGGKKLSCLLLGSRSSQFTLLVLLVSGLTES